MVLGVWVLAYNNDMLVGARQYNGNIIDVPVMGSDNTDFTVNYCESGDIPEFKLYRPTTGMLNNLSGSVSAWSNHNITVLDSLLPLYGGNLFNVKNNLDKMIIKQ